MAIPTGPASRPKRKHEDGSSHPVAPGAQDSKPSEAIAPVAPTANLTSQARTTAPLATAPSSSGSAERPRHREASQRDSGVREGVRQSGRIPSEFFGRDVMLSPAVLALPVIEFVELLYQGALHLEDLTMEELFRMRDQATWPEVFVSGDPRQLFTEDMCRRGQFVPIGWHSDALSVASSKDDAAQDELLKALDLLVGLPVTLYSVPQDAIDAGVNWLYRRSQAA